MRRDSLVLTLLRYEIRNALFSCRKSVLVRVVFLGGGILAYTIAGIAANLHSQAAALRLPLWSARFGGAEVVLGVLMGIAIARIATSRAFSPFLRALPLSIDGRRRMALTAALAAAPPLAILTGIAATGVCLAIEKPHPVLWAAGAALMFGAGFIAGVLAWLRLAFRDPDTRLADVPKTGVGIWSVRLRWLDRANPAWLGSWAWNLPAGHFRFTARVTAVLVLFVTIALMPMAASLAQHRAGPAATAAFAGGLLAFMLTLRCHPLRSPVLRTAPIGLTRVWLRTLRLPAIVSALFFALPASAALAAEPSSWEVTAGGGFGLLALNAAYAVFAAYFATAPLSAAVGFVAAAAFACYEWFEYGQTALLGFAVLIAWLWHGARRRYYHG